MVRPEEPECGVCLEFYSKSVRVPRVLYCNHTFCDACLDRIAEKKKDMIHVRCPVCRQTSCVRDGRALQEALYVNTRLWDGIADNPEDEAGVTRAVVPTRPLWPRNDHLGLHLLRFLKKFILPRQTERIVPGCNVQMKSWRRLSGREMP